MGNQRHIAFTVINHQSSHGHGLRIQVNHSLAQRVIRVIRRADQRERLAQLIKSR